MEQIRPYTSLDVETTGLKPETGEALLSIGMVFDDGFPQTPVDQMPKLHIGLPITGDLVGNDYALKLNAKLITHLRDPQNNPEFADMKILGPGDAAEEIKAFICTSSAHAQAWDSERGITKPEATQILSKNGEKLDIPFMNLYFARVLGVDPRWFTEIISHRGIDLGSLYVPQYGRNVSLSVINKDLGVKPVTHNALQDAVDNVVGYRNVMFKQVVIKG